MDLKAKFYFFDKLKHITDMAKCKNMGLCLYITSQKQWSGNPPTFETLIIEAQLKNCFCMAEKGGGQIFVTSFLNGPGVNFIKNGARRKSQSSFHQRPTPMPNFLRNFLLAQKLGARVQGAKTIYEIDPRSDTTILLSWSVVINK